MQIRKAERKKAKLRLGICGASGSGKTRSALEIAAGMGGKIGMIDTEAGRGELYANCESKYDKDLKLDYDVIRLDAPYSPERYIEAIKTFEKEGYDILIIDSLSHAWAGEGGVLSIVDNAGGQYQNGWKIGTPKQNKLIDTIITSKLHIICTLRVKTEYVVEKNEKGKNAPRKIGLAPVQRDQLEYEFLMFMTINQEHVAHVTKDNTEMFDQEFVTPTPEMGKKLMEWLNKGSDPTISPKELFMTTTLPGIVEEILECETENDLRAIYSRYYKKYGLLYPEAIDEMTVAKDKCKEKLSNEEIVELPDIDDIAIANKFHKSGNSLNKTGNMQ